MSQNKNIIVHGPEIVGEIQTISVGIHLHRTLRSNANLEIIDLTNDLKITFGDVLTASCKLANFLRSHGLAMGDTVAVCSQNNVHFHKPVFASLFCGVTVAMVNHTYTENELQHALDVAKPKIAFCSRATWVKFQQLVKKSCVPYLRQVVILEDLDFVLKDFPNTFDPIALNSKETTAAILYSSGTTGLSKGVMITHHNINFKYNHTLDPRYQLLDNRPFIVVPFYHAFGFVLSLVSIMNAKSIMFLEKFDEVTYLKNLEKYRVRSITAVPPLMVLLAKSPKVDQYKLCIEEIACGAAPLGKSLEDAVKKRLNVKIIKQAYGLTETTLGALSSPSGENKSGSCGKALSGLSVMIRDPETGSSLGPHKSGEICIKGGVVMKGYYGNEEATKATFSRDGWLLTGDVAYYDEDEFFYIVDRLKELIKYKGFQVAPAELEALLLTHPKIADAGVVGVPDDLVGEKPMAFVVKRPGSDLTTNDVIQFVKSQVSAAKQLHGGVKFVNAIPKNPSGKIMRRQLRSLIKTKSKL